MSQVSDSKMVALRPKVTLNGDARTSSPIRRNARTIPAFFRRASRERCERSGSWRGAGCVGVLFYRVIERGATHLGVATDHVVESFRNDLYPGYKTSEGVDPQLLSQFPILEEAPGCSTGHSCHGPWLSSRQMTLSPQPLRRPLVMSM